MPLSREQQRSLRARFANARRWRTYYEREADAAAARFQELAERHRKAEVEARDQLEAGGLEVAS